MEEVSRQSYRVGIHEALKHLIVTGNALIYLPDEGGLRVFHLDRFVVQRDPMGRPVKIITKETLAYNTLSDELKDAAGFHEGDSPDKACDLYTSVCLHGDTWEVHQEIKGNIVPIRTEPLRKINYLIFLFGSLK